MEDPNTKPPAGTRDFLPEQVKLREKLLAQVKNIFESFGFAPIDTPAFERIETLTEKYGEEGDQLMFKILKRGEKAKQGEVDLALRYDLTIPLARFYAEHRSQLPKIFKRHHIGPVWRADRSGKGRFKEFYQCDIDTIGSKSPAADAEIVLMLSDALHILGVPEFTIRINSRKILKGLIEAYGIQPELEKDFLVALDKLDKIGIEGVKKELANRKFSQQIINAIAIDLEKSAEEIKDKVGNFAIGEEGITEVKTISDIVSPLMPKGCKLEFSPFLARGLDYYTGFIFEVYAEGLGSSIAAGGRYDNLIGLFTNKPVPACGGTLGFERILLTREKTGQENVRPQVLMTSIDASLQKDIFRIAKNIRNAGKISVELYFGNDNINKQIGYAAERGIRFCVLFGQNEKTKGIVSVKDLETGEQVSVPEDQTADTILNLIK